LFFISGKIKELDFLKNKFPELYQEIINHIPKEAHKFY
jgi:hypothetical protein